MRLCDSNAVSLAPRIDGLTYNHDVLIDRGEVRQPGLLYVRVNVPSHRSVLIVGHQLRKATRTHTGYRTFDAQITRRILPDPDA